MVNIKIRVDVDIGRGWWKGTVAAAH